jgi:hypothetical protein
MATTGGPEATLAVVVGGAASPNAKTEPSALASQ